MKEEEDLAAAHAEITGVGGTPGFLPTPRPSRPLLLVY